MEADIFMVLAVITALLMSACCVLSYSLLIWQNYRRRQRRMRIREAKRRRESFKIYNMKTQFTELDLGGGMKEIRERPW